MKAARVLADDVTYYAVINSIGPHKRKAAGLSADGF